MRKTTLIAALLAIMLFVVSVAFAEQDKNLLSFNISPNPMDKLCTISVVLNSPMFVTLQVQTLEGTVIRDLYSGDTFKDINVQWDRNDNTGSFVPAGKYIVALDYNTRYTSTKKTLYPKIDISNTAGIISQLSANAGFVRVFSAPAWFSKPGKHYFFCYIAIN